MSGSNCVEKDASSRRSVSAAGLPAVVRSEHHSVVDMVVVVLVVFVVVDEYTGLAVMLVVDTKAPTVPLGRSG